jgi:hypothetical protein
LLEQKQFHNIVGDEYVQGSISNVPKSLLISSKPLSLMDILGKVENAKAFDICLLKDHKSIFFFKT